MVLQSSIVGGITRESFLHSDGKNLYESPVLLYVDGYKYQSRIPMVYQTFIYPKDDIITDLIILRTDGWMWVSPYFAWDGCSSLTWDDSTNMCAGHCHDALYALHRLGLLDLTYRPLSDECLHRLMLRDGSWNIRADYYRFAVNKGGLRAATVSRKVLEAPKLKYRRIQNK